MKFKFKTTSQDLEAVKVNQKLTEIKSKLTPIEYAILRSEIIKEYKSK